MFCAWKAVTTYDLTGIHWLAQGCCRIRLFKNVNCLQLQLTLYIIAVYIGLGQGHTVYHPDNCSICICECDTCVCDTCVAICTVKYSSNSPGLKEMVLNITCAQVISRWVLCRAGTMWIPPFAWNTSMRHAVHVHPQLCWLPLPGMRLSKVSEFFKQRPDKMVLCTLCKTEMI